MPLGIIYASRRPGSSIETRNGNSNKVHGLHRKNSNDLDTSQKSDSDVSDEVDESPALEELRLNSSTTLAEISSQVRAIVLRFTHGSQAGASWR